MSVELKQDFDGFMDAYRAGLRKGLYQAASITQISITRLLALHGNAPKQNPTPSPPGQPPGLRTGTLHQSIQIDDRGLRRKNPTVRIGTKVVYARIHELGGMTGRNLAARMPKRPYLAPGLKAARPAAEKAITAQIRGSLKRFRGVR